MELRTTHHALELPAATRGELETFRRRVRQIKLAEGLLGALFGLLLSYLFVFGLDRVLDTPAWLRATILIAGTTGLALWLPLKCHRWLWGTRRLEQVARLLRHSAPRLSDHLLGIIELVRNVEEQERSVTLCRAALSQVDREVSRHDFKDAVPHPRHKRWAIAAAIPLALTLTAAAVVPDASRNAFFRWLLPFGATERFTFARLDGLPEEPLVVPYAEPFSLTVQLAQDTRWSPETGTASYAGQEDITAELSDGRYVFEVPPQQEAGALRIAVGDAIATLDVEPTTRPELTSIVARVRLPEYLQRPDEMSKDVRGGTVSILAGSEVRFVATASRELARASLDGGAEEIAGAEVRTRPSLLEESHQVELAWVDRLGLEAREPFTIEVRAVEDEAPTLSASQLSAETVLLEDDVLSFQIQAQDDFGLRELGLEWEGIEDRIENPEPAVGEKIIAAGDPERETMDATATFSARQEGVPPQALRLRLYATDYHPDRGRIYSPTFTVVILSPEDHAIWLTRQLDEWRRRALEVYEQEQRLYQVNQQLRSLPAEELDRPENRRRIEAQAAAEIANGRRLGMLTEIGENLVEQATRNDQFNVATLEDLAGALRSLKDLAENRMPSVADLLKEAADAPGQVTSAPKRPEGEAGDPSESQSPTVAIDRNQQSGSGKPDESSPPNEVPSITDTESSLGAPEGEDVEPKEPESSTTPGRLTLPSTSLAGAPQPAPEAPPEEPGLLDEPVEEQQDLLAEFARVTDELSRILGNLEGSTFVKRLKAASRRQLEVARDVNRNLVAQFGEPEEQREEERPWAQVLHDREVVESGKVSDIERDLEAYYNRVQEGKFQTVLQEMTDMGVVGELQEIGGNLLDGFDGQSIAKAEYWGDALDRWAEQLVGPG